MARKILRGSPRFDIANAIYTLGQYREKGVTFVYKEFLSAGRAEAL